MKIEVGKTYLNRRGRRVTIEGRSGSVYPFDGDDGECYTPDGRFWTSGESPLDLVAPDDPETRDGEAQ